MKGESTVENKKSMCVRKSVLDGLILVGLIGGLWLKIIYSQLSTKINKVPLNSHQNMFMYGMLLLTIIMVFTLVYVIGYKYGLGVAYGVAAFLAFIIFGDTVYGRYFYNPITTSLVNQVSQASDVVGSALALIKWKDIIFILDFAVIIIIRLVIKGIGVTIVKDYSFKRVLIVCGALFAGAIIIFSIRYDQVEDQHYAYERKYMARDLGLLYYHGYDIKTSLARLTAKTELSDEDRALIASYNGLTLSGPNKFTGIAKGRNLIIVQIEAFMDYLIDYEVDGQMVTPFLNSLQKNSLYMSNCFIQTANGNTVDAELLMNTSLLPTYSGAVYYEYPTNTYVTLPKALREEGYKTYSFHGYEASFWNREVMHKVIGFDKFHSLDDFDLNDKVGWAVSDQSFYKQSLDFTEEKIGDSKFYDFMITLSSHYPYEAFYQGPFTDVEGTEGIVNRYYNAARYADESVEVLFEELKERGLYDNSIIVIYGDHAGLFNQEAQQQAQVDGKLYNEYEWMKYQTTPVFIHIPGEIEDGYVMEEVTAQMDILPTVANLMDLSLTYTLGSDMLSDTYKGMSIKRFGDVITDDYIYISNEGVVYDYDTGEVLVYDDYKESIGVAHQYLRVSDKILSGDYFRNE